MKRVIAVVAALVLLVVGLWAGATYLFGMKAEERYHAMLKQASTSPYVKFVNTSYRRGVSQSQAQTVVEIQLPPSTTGTVQNFKIPLTQEIAHGPFPLGKMQRNQRPWEAVMAVIETRLTPGSELQNRFAELLTQVPELASMQDYTVIYLDGKGEEHLVVPAFHRTFGTEEPVEVTWKGLSLQADFSIDLKTFSGSFSMPGLALNGKGLTLGLGEVKSAFASSEGISGLWLGDASLTLTDLNILDAEDSGAKSLLFHGFAANTATKATGDNITAVLALRMELVQVDGTQYGPGVVEIELRNLDAPSLARLQQSLREETVQPGQSSNEAQQMKNLARYMEILPDLLKKSPELEVKQCDLKTSLGDFTGNARIAFDGTKGVALSNLLTIYTALTAQTDFKIGEGLLRSILAGIYKKDVVAEVQEHEGTAPGEAEIKDLVAERVEERLAGMTAQNLLVKGNGSYTFSARYVGGKITLNGRPLSLQELVQ